MATGLVIGMGLGVVAGVSYFVALGLAWVTVLLLVPEVGILCLLVAVCLVPTLNFPILNVGGGRVYASDALLVSAALAAIPVYIQRPKPRGVMGVCLIGFVVVGLHPVSRSTIAGTFTWILPFVSLFAAYTWVSSYGPERLLRLLCIAGLVGLLLGDLHAVVHAFDPFRFTRPKNIPYVSRISIGVGTITRATGAFVYPNDYGIFAAFITTIGSARLVLNVPKDLGRRLSWLMVLSGLVALALSVSRAAIVAYIVAFSYLVWKAQISKKMSVLATVAMASVPIAYLASQSRTIRHAVQVSLSTGTGKSFGYRVSSAERGLTSFVLHPLFGSGLGGAKLDAGWIDLLYMGGIIGSVLFASAWYAAFYRRASGAPWAVVLWALLAVVMTASLFEDVIGQTLNSWVIGVVGACVWAARPTGGQGVDTEGRAGETRAAVEIRRELGREA